MTLLFLDGCDNDTTKWDSKKGVSSNLTVSTTTGGYSLFFPASGATYLDRFANYVQKNFRENTIATETYPSIRASFWMKTSGNVTAENRVMMFEENGFQLNFFYLLINTAGKLSISTTSGGTSIPQQDLARTSNRVDDGNWHHIEIYVKTANNSTGISQIIMDDQYVTTFNGDNFQQGNGSTIMPTKYNVVTFGQCIGANLYIDDIFIWDDYDTDGWTGTKGLRNILTIRPQSDVISNSVPSYGSTRYDLLNQYKANTSNTISLGKGHYDLYDFTNVSTTLTSSEGKDIFGLATTICYASETQSNTTNATFLISDLNTTKSNNAGQTTLFPNTYLSKTQTYFYNPIDNSVWTPTNLNSMKFGILIEE